jgi:hypothetical protein
VVGTTGTTAARKSFGAEGSDGFTPSTTPDSERGAFVKSGTSMSSYTLPLLPSRALRAAKRNW